ncbi:putative F-box/LRR-repeat protein At3g28410 [Vigna umbellata]|uniref:putative F-box/LRR-repeat protein At3g28410 n=1 Tax=Vigna umbellata TaxID=87088 RepID=UPI001F5F0575|nr:putative F-box/LRR-repeat protein At3g28410 [Vigna umbellata]XP_047155172.1 putative F-box/LRR-repeat protein At3g28410 [Vigna umbellata]
MEEEKESMAELKTQTKEKQKSEKEREDEKDFISALPDDVLLHIIHFVDTVTAVRTSFLSKRWNNLWKCLTALSFRPRDFKTVVTYNQFVFRVLAQRDTSIRVHHLDLEACDNVTVDSLCLFVSLLHFVPNLILHSDSKPTKQYYYSIPAFSSPYLTSLTLTLTEQYACRILELPKSLELPALKTLNLTHVSFAAGDNDEYSEPFSSCFLLNSLVLVGCSIKNPAKVLVISNPNLSRFTVKKNFEAKYKILLSTSNLTHLDIRSSTTFHDVNSTCDLALLEEANIGITRASHLNVQKLLKIISYAKILTLSEYVLRAILRCVSDPRILPPRFVRLETLKGKKIKGRKVLMKYLLQNSERKEVEVINF